MYNSLSRVIPPIIFFAEQSSSSFGRLPAEAETVQRAQERLEKVFLHRRFTYFLSLCL